MNSKQEGAALVPTDNELIAEFMGLPLTKTEIAFTSGLREVPFQNWQYNTSWDWLMPVVHKILKTTEPLLGQGWSHEYIELDKTRVGNSIEYVYYRVVRFIKWYNENIKK